MSTWPGPNLNAPIPDFWKQSENLCVYDFFKFYNIQWKTAMFTHASDIPEMELGFMQRIHNKKLC